MGTTFDIENAKLIRQAPDILRIGLSDWYLIFERKDVISVMMDLKCVDTKLDNPELQASTIEAKVYVDSWTASQVERLKGSGTTINYRCGYTDGEICTDRTFYTTDDGLKVDGKVLTIKGTDYVGTVKGENPGKIFEIYSLFPYSGKNYANLKDIYNQYTDEVLKGVIKTTKLSDYKDYAPNLYMDEDSFSINRYLVVENKSRRKLMAELMNIFRGSNPKSPDRMAKRFVFRDGGIPAWGWCETAIAGWQTSGKHQMKTWEIAYRDVADLREEYGNNVKTVKLDNTNNGITGYVSQEEPIEIRGGQSKIVTLTNPGTCGGYESTGSSSVSISISQISPTTVKVTATGSGTKTVTLKVSYFEWDYQSGEEPPNVSISTGLSNGDTIELERINGVTHINGIKPADSSVTYSDFSMYKNALQHTLNDCNLKAPRWIYFTWRGHPEMQPRDILIFTAKNKTKAYYEIDSLTLEHEGGGLKSQVKAIYKCPYN